MADNWKVLATAALILLCAGMAKTASYYHGKFVSADSLATERQETITDMQRRQQSVAALDAKYTKELADAKATIDQLHDDVTTGKRRLQLNATCQKQSSSGTSGVGDDSTARLTADAERNYWRLRSGISTITNQVTYLQDYINRICLK
ncbi:MULTISPECIES: lysis protein [Pantoea]|uniref:lysis protein n=1 Tax=Pantoea TaxID=53335 RepID=UPI000F0A898A|nr:MULTISPECIES: lysis protein [Pantoea]MBZ6396546.1 lysis protein [Pantoea sp.]MBZ6438379.1 lysis protein [Pantoea sp.]